MTETDSIVEHLMRVAERNERQSREIQWARRLIWLIAVAAFAAGFAVRGMMGDLL